MGYNISKLNLYLRYMLGVMLTVFFFFYSTIREVVIAEIILMNFFVIYIVKHTEYRSRRYR